MKKVLYTLVFLALGLEAAAQNQNHTVEVTNTYRREASGIAKPDIKPVVPDSVTRFDYNFDYSVKTTPYRGAYEFKPYYVQLKPSQKHVTENTLFASMGLGYSFHPEANLVWTAVKKDNLHLNVYGDYNGYAGLYRGIEFDGKSFADTPALYSGLDSRAKIGADLRLEWLSGTLDADVRYTNTAATDRWAAMSTHGVMANATVKGVIGTTLRYNASEYLKLNVNSVSREILSTTRFGAGMPLGQAIANLDIKAEYLNYFSDVKSGAAGNFEIIPSYSANFGDLHLKAGVKLAFIVRSDASFMPNTPGFLFPDVSLTYDLIPETLVLQASASGENRLNTLDRILELNHFAAGISFIPDNSVERIRLMAGARGNIKKRLDYDVKAGFYRLENALSWGYTVAGAGYAPIIGYMSPLNVFYAGADFAWKTDHLWADASLYYQYTLTPQILTPVQSFLFSPPSFKGKASVHYLWGGRYATGLTLDSMSGRFSVNALLPGFADLGISQKFNINRHAQAWVKIGNLLNQSIQRVPFHAERGIYFTLGANLLF